jgi:cytidylate kinase
MTRDLQTGDAAITRHAPTETHRVPGPIAIDGPVASGKSTVGRRLAARLGWTFVDTGLMYRAVAHLAQAAGIALDDADALVRLIQEVGMRVDDAVVTVKGGRDIGPHLMAAPVAQAASRVAELPAVRRALVARQKELASAGNVVMVGRDIGAVVLPDALLKVYLDAPAEERARRRLRDEQARGRAVTLQRVLDELEARDRRDQERAASPLAPAPGAVILQTADLTIDQVVDAILDLARRAAGPRRP